MKLRNRLRRQLNLVRGYPPRDVTARNAEAEVDPCEVGLCSAEVDRIWRTVEGVYRTGLYPAVGLCLRRRGKVVVDRSIGHQSGNAPLDSPDAPKVLATPGTLYNIFSASKSVTAMVVHLLDQKGLVHLDDRLVEYIPEFGKHGKQWITLRHLLTHRAGIPAIPASNRAEALGLLHDFDAIAALICDAKPTFRPGRRLAYHALTAGFVIGEVVRRVTGQNIRHVLDREILGPLGFEHLSYGVSEADIGKVARNAFTGPSPPPPLGFLLKRALGVTLEQGVEYSNDPRFLTAIVPAGNVIGTANEACRFFELLLNEGELDGVRIFEPRTVRRAVLEQTSYEVDLTLGVPLRYAMGFILGGHWFSLYGPGTASAYGHLGFTNVLTWADPRRRLSACFMTSGKPFVTPGVLRWLNVMRVIAQIVPRE